MQTPGEEPDARKRVDEPIVLGIPKSHWRWLRTTLKRAGKKTSRDNIGIVAAGVAFFMMLSVFPALAAFIALYGLVADPADVAEFLTGFDDALPEDAYHIIQEQLQALTTSTPQALTLGLIVGFGAALWSAGKGMRALIKALNIAYGAHEKRHVIKQYGLSLLLTACTISFGVAALALLAALPAVLEAVGIGHFAQTILNIARWPILAAAVMGFLAVMYAVAPCRSRPDWKWTSPGAVVAALVWLLASILFSIYVANFGNFNATYGSVAAVVVLLMWFYISAYVVLLGAELNAQVERTNAGTKTDAAPKPPEVMH